MHVVITGLGRTATKWLAKMLDANTDARVAHEPFTRHEPAAGLALWASSPAPVSVCVNSYAREMISDVHRALSPKWIVVYRDPTDVVRSAFTRPTASTYHRGCTDDVYAARAVARVLLGDLESCLVELDSLGVDYDCHGFRSYTTPDGFRALARDAGLTVREPLRMVDRANASQGRPRVDVAALRPYVEMLVEGLPRVRRVAERARERAPSALESSASRSGGSPAGPRQQAPEPS